jgi:hypothetical protein
MSLYNKCKVELARGCTGNVSDECVDGFDNPYRMPYSSYEFFAVHAAWVVPRLKELRDHGMGCPGSFVPCKDNGETDNSKFKNGFERWRDILDKMIKAFEAIDHGEDESSSFKRHSFVDEGLDLFREYYFNLWD